MLCSNCRHKRAHSRGVLYHFTYKSFLREILKDDILIGTKVKGDSARGVSLTRKAKLRFGNTSIRIALDTQKIMQDGYKLKNFDYYSIRSLKEDNDSESRRNEAEEVLLGDLPKLHSYILGIEIDNVALKHTHKDENIADMRSDIISWIEEYEAKHNLSIDTNFMSNKMYELPRDTFGKIPSRYDKYKGNTLDWRTREQVKGYFSEKEINSLVDEIISVFGMLAHNMRNKYYYIDYAYNSSNQFEYYYKKIRFLYNFIAPLLSELNSSTDIFNKISELLVKAESSIKILLQHNNDMIKHLLLRIDEVSNLIDLSANAKESILKATNAYKDSIDKSFKAHKMRN